MTEPTYTIKPLEWEGARPDVMKANCHSEFEWAVGIFGCLIEAFQYDDDAESWHWTIEATIKRGHDLMCMTVARSPDNNNLKSLAAAKLAAESAYRRLLAEHLVEVK